MPTIQVDAYTSGRSLWNANLIKKVEVIGWGIDNQGANNQTLQLYDGFTTIASKTNAAGAAQAAEDLGTSNVLSGKIRKQITVPMGQSKFLEKDELADVEFLAAGWLVASTTDTGCISTVQYRFRDRVNPRSEGW